MAPTAKAVRRFGWENQRERLTATHMAAGVAALTIAGELRNRTRLRATISRPDCGEPASKIVKNDQPDEFTLASVRDLQTQVARQNLAAREMKACLEALSARATEADKRYAELQDELNVARDEILLQQNDKYCLQTSLDILTRNNAGLARRLNAEQLEHNNLTAKLQEACQKSQIEL